MRLIDADALRETVLCDNAFGNEIVNYYLDLIDSAETVEAVEPKRGFGNMKRRDAERSRAMNADVERAMNWLKGMADDRGYTEHLAHGGKGDPIEEQEIECASTALKYIESLQAQLAKEKRRTEKALGYIEKIFGCDECVHNDTNYETCKSCNIYDKWQWRGDAEEGDAE